MADDLITWLHAPLDDDERIARAGSLTPSVPSWRASENLVYDADAPDDNSALNVAQSEWDEAAAHIARHDPARVLAEVEAKRRILDELERIRQIAESRPLDADIAQALDRIAAALALPYADRPGYRQECRP